MLQDTELALQVFEERKERNRGIERVDNARLHAGSPMFYYCQACGGEMVRSETHFGAAPTHCPPCEALVANGTI